MFTATTVSPFAHGCCPCAALLPRHASWHVLGSQGISLLSTTHPPPDVCTAWRWASCSWAPARSPLAPAQKQVGHAGGTVLVSACHAYEHWAAIGSCQSACILTNQGGPPAPLAAVAALVISLFPRLPASTMDHRCHLQARAALACFGARGHSACCTAFDVCSLMLFAPPWLALGPALQQSLSHFPTRALQAFRHLYVLAAQPRSVDAIDVDTKQVSRFLGPGLCCLKVRSASGCVLQFLTHLRLPCAVLQPVYVPLQIELSGAAVPTLGDGQHVGSVLRPVSSVSKVRLVKRLTGQQLMLSVLSIIANSMRGLVRCLNPPARNSCQLLCMAILCLPCPLFLQGTGDVLAELAAQAAASLQQGFSFDVNHTGATAGPAGGQHTSISISFDRIAPCLLPEQKQVGRGWRLGFLPAVAGRCWHCYARGSLCGQTRQQMVHCRWDAPWLCTRHLLHPRPVPPPGGGGACDGAALLAPAAGAAGRGARPRALAGGALLHPHAVCAGAWRQYSPAGQVRHSALHKCKPSLACTLVLLLRLPTMPFCCSARQGRCPMRTTPQVRQHVLATQGWCRRNAIHGKMLTFSSPPSVAPAFTTVLHPSMRSPFPPTCYPGVRSLLSRMVHHAGGGSPGASSNGGVAADSYDLVNLCSTFGSDPSITSFAQVGRRGGAGGCLFGGLM